MSDLKCLLLGSDIPELFKEYPVHTAITAQRMAASCLTPPAELHLFQCVWPDDILKD